MRYFLLLPITWIAFGCSRFSDKQENIPPTNWMQKSITELSPYHTGWDFFGGSGGGSSDGGAYRYELRLKGKSLSSASGELKSSIENQLKKNGFTVNGGGGGGVDFSIRASSPYVRGTIMVIFSEPTDTGIPIAIAVAQVERH